MTRRNLLKNLLTLPLVGLIDRRLQPATSSPAPAKAAQPRPPIRGNAVPILTAGLIRLRNGSTISISPTAPMRYIEHPDSRLLGTEVRWDRATGEILS